MGTGRIKYTSWYMRDLMPSVGEHEGFHILVPRLFLKDKKVY